MEATLDKVTTKIENGIAYYTENLDQLYRFVIGLALISYLYSVVMIAWTYVRYAPDVITSPEVLSVPQVYTPILIGLAYTAFMALLAIATRKRLRDQSPTAITLFAVFLVLNLAGLHVFVFMIGMWALFNGKFREHSRAWAPEWYRNLTSALE